MITVRYWAAARQAAGVREERLEATTIEGLRALLADRPELDRVCSASSYLIDGEQAHEGSELPDGSVVDVLPPFAGG